MLNKNIKLKLSGSRDQSNCQKSKLNSSLVISQTFKSSLTSYYTPKQKVDGGFTSPTFSMDTMEDQLESNADRQSTTAPSQMANDLMPGLSKQKYTCKSKDVFNNSSLKRDKNQNHSFSHINIYSKLKQTASTNSTDQSELNGLINLPSFFKQKKRLRKDPMKIPVLDSFNREPSRPCQQGFIRKELKIEQFRFIKKLGQGKFGKVFLAVDQTSGMLVGVKVLEKKKIMEENLIEQLIRELKIQSFLDHPNLIKLYGIFHDKTQIYIIMELGVDGQLYRLMETGKLSEEATSFIAKSLLQAIDYMHGKAVLHRDIKPQNIVLIHGTVKLCDFGWAVNIKNQLRSTFCGTPLYLSPQILMGNFYNQKVDLWAIGVMCYEIFLGQSPFQITQRQHLNRIITHEIYYPSCAGQNNAKVSPEFKTFINSILRKNPKERLNSKQLLELNFISRYSEFETCSELCF